MRSPLLFALAPLVPLAAALATSPEAPPQDPDELDADLAGYGEAALGMEVEEVWNLAQNVAFVLGDEVGAPFDAAVDRALRGDDFAGKASLFLVATRLLGDDVDWELVAAELKPLLSSQDEGLVAGAADLVGSSEFQSQDLELREGMTDALLVVATAEARSADLRAACAVAAHQVGLGDQVPKARKVLYDFMNSADAGLRARGALGLAGLGIIEGVPAVESELDRLASLPGEHGRLAKAYIKQLQIRRFKDTELRRAREQARDMVISGASSPDLQQIEKLISLVQQYHLDGNQVDRQELIEAAMDGLLHSLDRHSAYFSPDAYKKFEQDLEAEYGGIGAYVRTDNDDGLFTITRPIYSGPAYEAGLSSDDKIVRVGDWPTIGQPDDEVIKRLKGKPGTPIRVYVWRRGMDPGLISRPTEDMAVEIERAIITIPPVNALMLPGGIGLVELTTFSRVASQELRAALESLLDQGARGMILDLRNNSGGLLTEARNVADLFLPPGKSVVSTETRISRPKTLNTRIGAVVPEDMPIITLVNRYSASASEIVSGALQDHGRSVIVGQRTFGKGSVQNLLMLDREGEDRWADENGNRRYDDWETITLDHDGDGEFDYSPRIKMTIERYRLPTGRSIHREFDDEGNIVSDGGVSPDVEIGPTRREQWRLVEMRKLQDTRVLRNWVSDQYEDQKAVFDELALGDDDDCSRYPGFDDLFASLDTVLPRTDVRFLLRMEVRRVVQDARGKAFPYGSDYQEDIQLQTAIAQVFEALGEAPTVVAAYAKTFDEVGEDGIVHGVDGPGGR